MITRHFIVITRLSTAANKKFPNGTYIQYYPSGNFFVERCIYRVLTIKLGCASTALRCFLCRALKPLAFSLLRLSSLCPRLNRSAGSPMATLHCSASAISGVVLRTSKIKIPKSVSKLPFVDFTLCTYGVRPLLRSA